MGDPLSVAASAIAVAHTVKRIYEIGNAAYNSKHEKEEFNNVMETLSVQVSSLEDLAAKVDASPEDPRFNGFRAIIKHSKHFNKGKEVEPDPNEKDIGVLQRLAISMDEMEAKLVSRTGLKGYSRRLLWIHERKKFEEFIGEIKQWTDVVSSVLTYDHFLNDIETNDYVRDTSSRVKNLEIEAAKAAEDRKSALEDRRRAAIADERRTAEKERKAKEKLRLEIVRWMSPLKFRERHSVLMSQPEANSVRPQLLHTEEFEVWTKGRQWILHCEGKPGAGKVLSHIICASNAQKLF